MRSTLFEHLYHDLCNSVNLQINLSLLHVSYFGGFTILSVATELSLILILGVIFVVPIATNLNVGLVAFAASILAGSLLLSLSSAEIMAGFPGQMFILLVGITLLLAIAQANGTIDWVVRKLMALARGQLVLLPWLLFFTAYITSSLGPTAVPMLFVIGVGFIAKYKINPLLIAVMIIHGAQSGAYSPIAPYGVVIGQLADELAVSYSPLAVYLGVSAFHLLLALVVFFVLGGHRLRRRTYVSDPVSDWQEGGAAKPITYLTLVGFLALFLSVILFGAHLGFTAIVVALVILLASDNTIRTESVNRIAWPIILVISGVLTYVNLIQDAGAIQWLANQVSSVGSPLFVGLLLSYIVAIVTGVASTIGTIGMLIPLSAPFIVSGDLNGTGLITAMAISAAISDVSPFSTWGALFLATAASTIDREKMLRSQLVYTLVVVSLLPLIAWLIFLVAWP